MGRPCPLTGRNLVKQQLPAASIFHGCPRFCWGLCLAFLQQFKRDTVRRFNKGHAPITWRPVNSDSLCHQFSAGGVNIFHGKSQVSKISAACIGFLAVPVIGQLNFWRALSLGLFQILVCSQKDKGEFPSGTSLRRVSTMPSLPTKKSVQHQCRRPGSLCEDIS